MKRRSLARRRFGRLWKIVYKSATRFRSNTRSSLENLARLPCEALEARLAPAVVIAEFMASNDTTLADEDGSYSDWIELENTADETVDLDGWYLTDDVDRPTRWQLPDVALAGGQRLLIYASGKDRRDPTGSLHANFRLDADGEYLALIDADGTTVQHAYAPQYPEQSTDVSYGIGSSGRRGFFHNPTPGAVNGVITSDGGAAVVISEIMYSLPRESILDPEDRAQEFIELHNRSASAVDLTGWEITEGVTFRFPSATLDPGQFLVVAADVPAFQAKYPDVMNVVGGWQGKLSNSGESIAIEDRFGALVDRVRYADQGDWAMRTIEPFTEVHSGWTWSAGHDGGGDSLELINIGHSNDNGQNWTTSDLRGGTPGRSNSAASSDIAPLISSVQHRPVLPNADHSVTISAHVADELSGGVQVEVDYRVTNDQPFTTVVMVDDGTGGDLTAGDNVFSATLPPQADRTVVEFYVRATDVNGQGRTWPAASSTGAQDVNAVYQVIDEFDRQAWQPGEVPIYYIIMTPHDRATFNELPRRLDAEFNATFIAVTGSEIDVRYNTGVRYRGSGSRNDPVPNYRVNFAHDRPWQGVTAINLNQRNPVSQAAGSAIFQVASIPAADVQGVRVFSNGVDLKDGGFYAHSEVFDSPYAENHFPTDPDGNLYRGRRPDESPAGGQGAGLTYFGPDPAPYVSYLKSTNGSEADWSDVIELTRILSEAGAAEPDFVENVRRVIDVDQWFRTIAVNALISNTEYGLLTGDPLGDDYALYRGVNDTRFQMVPYDWDSSFSNREQSIFRANNVPALNRLINHPEFISDYFAAFQDVIDNVVRTDTINDVIEESTRGIAGRGRVESIKSFMQARADFVEQQFHSALTVDPSLPREADLFHATEGVVTLTITAPQAGTHAVHVENHSATFNGQTWQLQLGTDPSQSLTLQPGMNRFNVASYAQRDATGSPTAETSLDIWYDTGEATRVSETIQTDTVWSLADSPFLVQGQIGVTDEATLTIDPGVTIFFEDDARLTVRGQLHAKGSAEQPIWFTRRPGHTSWNGIQFANSQGSNQIDHAIIEYGMTRDGMIGLENSALSLSNSFLDHANQRRIRSIDSSLVVRNSTFANLFEPNEEPTTDNFSEHVWGRGIPVGGQWILQGNTFGTLTGHNDAVDFDSEKDQDRFAQIIDNHFLGGGDDALDMTGDVYVEGNTFTNFRKDQFNTDPGESNTISSSDGTFWVVRNVFDNVDHAALIKEDAFMQFLQNSVISSEAAPLYFDLPGQTSGPGRGAVVLGSLFSDVPTTFDQVQQDTELTTNFSFFPSVDREAITGVQNQFGDPHVADADDGYRLLDGSPAMGRGPNGNDIGASIPMGVTISGTPPAVTNDTSATFVVGGPGYSAYRYQLDSGPVSETRPIADPIELDGLVDGNHTLRLWGRNAIGVWQAQPKTVGPWFVSRGLEATVRINEIQANSDDGLDRIELHNFGSRPLDISGYSLTDQEDDLRRFVFPSGTVVSAGGYLVLDASSEPTAGLRRNVGFGLDRNGEQLILSTPSGSLLDSVRFGLQAHSLSLGRRGFSVDRSMNNWTLTVPTFGAANRSAPLADPNQILINEWYASGSIRLTDDHLELYNPQPHGVAIGGLALTDEPFAVPRMSPIAPLSFIGAKGYADFTADGSSGDGADHLAFRLSSEREHVALRNLDGDLVDQVFYLDQTSNVSQGRQFNGEGDSSYAFMEMPSMGATNGDPAKTVLEWGWNSNWRYNASGDDLGSAWRSPDYDDSSWLSGPGLLGQENEPLPDTIRSEFDLTGRTYYFRKAFDIGTEFDVRQLTADFSTIVDDGFIVYVNGQEILRRGMPDGEIDASTLANRNINEASVEGPFELPATALNTGRNLIAVEVHQTSDRSSDLVFGLSLVATAPPAVSPSQQVFRFLNMTELMYHPDDGDNGVEFVELHNGSNSPLDVSGVRVSGGIDFQFSQGQSIPADGYAVITNDVDAFRSTYGRLNLPVLGEYRGQLNNGGEEIALQLAEPLDTAIQRFAYSPGWHPTTGGQGDALAVRDEAFADQLWSDGASWMAAVPSPGFATGQTDRNDLNHDNRVTAADIDLLCTNIRNNEPAGDVNDDSAVNRDDMTFYLRQRLNTTYGDANLDGVFNSSDIVAAFVNGQYEDDVAGNSTWADGDWNCDGEFTTSDLVFVFQFGGYSHT